MAEDGQRYGNPSGYAGGFALYFLRYGAMRLIRLRSPELVTSSILSNSRLVRLEELRRRWLLPPFVRMILPVPVTLNRLAAALYVFSLYFFGFCLADMIILSQKKAGPCRA